MSVCVSDVAFAAFANKAVFYTKYNRDNGGNVLDRMIMVAGEQGVASLNQVGAQFWSGGTAR